MKFLGILMLIANFTHAQFSIDGQFRTRGEYRDGYRLLATESTYGVPIVLQRSRLILSHKEDKLSFMFSGQDARIWGQNDQQMPDNTTHIYEAWAMWNFLPNFNLKLGRQELKYDDQRIIAIRNFSLTGITYDAALITYDNFSAKTSLHLGGMINNNEQWVYLTNYIGDLPKYMVFLWGSKTLNEMITINAINFFDLRQAQLPFTFEPNIMYGRNTIGANAIISSNDNFGGRMGGYYQFGSSWINLWPLANNNVEISAYSINANIWTKASQELKLSLTFDLYSGHDWSKTNGKFTSFNRLLAAGHAHLGCMDYFTSMQLAEVDWAGIVDFFLEAEYNFNDKANINAAIHNFSLHKPYIPAINAVGYEELDKRLGTEVDFIFNYRVSKDIAIQTAWMFMLPTESLEVFKGNNSKFSHYGYVSFLFTPNFFKYQKPDPQS